MKKIILLSIHPKFADLIIAGKKKYEYRKVMPNEAISHIALYCTSPIRKVVAIVEVIEELTDTPAKLWKKTSRDGAITKKHFNCYFNGKVYANAFKLGKVTLFDKPMTLTELCVDNSPQSFRYLSSNQIDIIFS